MGAILYNSRQTLRCCLSVRRNVFNCRGLVHNVYEQIGYTSPFSADESKLILDKVNGASSVQQLQPYVAKVRANHVLRHLKANGPFEVVEQLLDVKTFDPSILERMGRSLLQEEDSVQCPVEETKSENQEKTKALALLRYIKPKLDIQQNNVSSIVGMKFNLQTLSFVQYDCQAAHLSSWTTVDTFASYSATSRATFEHHRLCEVSLAAANSIPPADLYVFEEMLPIMTNDPYLTSKIRQTALQSSILSLLAARNQNHGCNNIFSMRVNVLNALFNLKIGGERMSVQDRIHDIVRPRHVTENPFRTDIPEEMWTYFMASTKAQREQMSSALLICLALSHILRHKSQ